MKPIIFIFNIFTSNFNGITLYPFIILKEKDSSVLAHELVHVRQIKQLGVFKFYFLYLKEYLKNVFIYPTLMDAYRNISFEVEARRDEHLLKLDAIRLLENI